MWRRALVGLLAVAACAERPRPYRFGSPMLAAADLPVAALDGAPPPARVAPSLVVRTAGAPQRPAPVPAPPSALGLPRAQLPAPNRETTPEPTVRIPDDLRALVGRRDPRPGFVVAMAWAHALGLRVPAASTGPELVAQAEAAGWLAAPTEPAAPGDLLVFDRTEGEPADLIAIAIGRDARGVTELIYVAGGVVRRGFVDPRRPALRRDADARVVNTFLRAGRRWPPKGTHYLAGELIAHVVHVH